MWRLIHHPDFRAAVLEQDWRAMGMHFKGADVLQNFEEFVADFQKALHEKAKPNIK
jgi:hypothetical protein